MSKGTAPDGLVHVMFTEQDEQVMVGLLHDAGQAAFGTTDSYIEALTSALAQACFLLGVDWR
jgi:hypothetical protein